jgi:hypothetical protein
LPVADAVRDDAEWPVVERVEKRWNALTNSRRAVFDLPQRLDESLRGGVDPRLMDCGTGTCVVWVRLDRAKPFEERRRVGPDDSSRVSRTRSHVLASSSA